jgi:hypothetical protein
VAQVGDCWLESGHRVPSYVTDALTELLAGGLVVLADQDPYGLRCAALTESGTARYEWLGQQQQRAVPVSVPGSAPPVSELVHDSDPTPRHDSARLDPRPAAGLSPYPAAAPAAGRHHGEIRSDP